MKKILFVLMILMIGIVGASESYTSTTDTICNNDICTKTIWSGIRNTYEDDSWKKVEDARSLKGSGIECVIKSDGEHIVKCLDWNMTNIDLEVSINSASLSAKQVPIKVYSKNESGDLNLKSEKLESFSLGSNKKEKEVNNFKYGDVIHFGESSTEIMLRDNESDNLGDTFTEADGHANDNGNFANLALGASNITRNHIFIKFNITAIPEESIIIESSLNFYLNTNNIDAGEDFNLTAHHIYPFPEYNISNLEWTEGTEVQGTCEGSELCWNTMPNVSSQYNITGSDTINLSDVTSSGQYIRWNVTNIIAADYGNSDNSSIWLNATITKGADTITPSDVYSIRSKRGDIIIEQRPYLNITYIRTCLGGNFPLCTSQEDCQTVGGFWYDESCHEGLKEPDNLIMKWINKAEDEIVSYIDKSGNFVIIGDLNVTGFIYSSSPTKIFESVIIFFQNKSVSISPELLNMSDGNISANYYFGDGSQLTNLPTGNNDSWNETHADELYISVTNTSVLSTQNDTYDAYVTNVSINHTKVTFDTYNTTWDDGSDNESWNETYADTLYTYYSDEEWINQNSTRGFVFNETMLATTYYNATQSQNISGIVDGGTLEDISHPDGAYDSNTFNFSEVASSPGLDMRMNFTGVEGFNNGIMRYRTSTLKGDYPIIQVWDYDGSDWEDYPLVAESESFTTIVQPVFDSSEHLQDGVVQMRMYKASNGNTQNKYYVDWVAISDGYGTPAGEEVDPHSIHRDGNTSLIGNWDAGAYNITAQYFKGLFNWTVIGNWFGWNGNTLSFNETLLNETIVMEGVRVGFNDTYNITYDAYATNVSLNYSKLTYDAWNILWSASNISWNETHANELYMKITNVSYLDTYNITYDAYATNVSLNYSKLVYDAWNTDWSSGNTSFNESYTNNLYMSITNVSYLDTYNATYDTYVTANYTNNSNAWDEMDTINATQMEDSGGTLNILVSWLTSLFYTETEVDAFVTSLNTTQNDTYDAYETNVSYGDIFVNTTGDNMTGDLNMQSGSNITFNGAVTFYYNGSGLIIE